MADSFEIEEGINTVNKGGCSNLAILHYESGYSAPPEDNNFKTIIDMRKNFSIPIGLSEQTIYNAREISNISLGASIIEKHIIINRNTADPDDSFSLEREELISLCRELKQHGNQLVKFL